MTNSSTLLHQVAKIRKLEKKTTGKVVDGAEPLDLSTELKPLKTRKRDAYKGDFGHVLIIGGDYGMGGSVRIAGEAAMRVGAGLVTVATREENVDPIISARPEIMVHGVGGAEQLRPLLTKATVIAIGPGLGGSNWGKSLYNLAIESKKPLVVDADGLNFLAKEPKHNDDWILTPHPGEAARLLQTTADKIQEDRIQAAQEIAKKFGGIIVLKGAGSLVFAKGEKIRVCDVGNPGMATAGMGDLLTGIIAGLIAQKLSLFDAAKLGVLVHALAGDLVAAAEGERGILALDLLPKIRSILNMDYK